MVSIILGFVGGLGIFLYGTHLLSNGLQKVAASKMRKFLASVTDTRIKGILSGIVVTFLLQSSTVTNILVVGLVGGSIITLSQAFGIILGSAIGTTLTLQVIAFNISQYASLFIFLGAIFIIFVKKNNMKSSGFIVLSIGFIFYGIDLISSSLHPLSENEHMLQFLSALSENPVLFMLVAMAITALLHSSLAMIIIGTTFITSGALEIGDILPLILGANVGSTIPVVISSFASRAGGKQVAMFYFLFKVSGVVLALGFLTYLTDAVSYLPGYPVRQIAHFHTLFNVAIAFIFFPFLPYISKLFYRFYPKKDDEMVFDIYLNESLLDVPEEALISSRNEITRLASFVSDNMIKRLTEFMEGKQSAQDIYKVEHIIDESYIRIQQYLLKLGQRDLSSEQSNMEVKLLNILNDIEHIGDTVVQFIGKAEQVGEKNIAITQRDQAQLKELIQHIEQTYTSSLKAFQQDDMSMARENIQAQSLINQFEKDVKFEHFNSLINKKEYNPEISAVYLDIVNQLLQVFHHSINISRTVLGLI